jgi:hypothetical protein
VLDHIAADETGVFGKCHPNKEDTAINPSILQALVKRNSPEADVILSLLPEKEKE